MFGEKLVKGSGFNRGIGVVVGDYEDIDDEILYCIQQDWPIFVLPFSDLGYALATAVKGEGEAPPGFGNVIKKGRWFICK